MTGGAEPDYDLLEQITDEQLDMPLNAWDENQQETGEIFTMRHVLELISKTGPMTTTDDPSGNTAHLVPNALLQGQPEGPSDSEPAERSGAGVPCKQMLESAAPNITGDWYGA